MEKGVYKFCRKIPYCLHEFPNRYKHPVYCQHTAKGDPGKSFWKWWRCAKRKVNEGFLETNNKNKTRSFVCTVNFVVVLFVDASGAVDCIVCSCPLLGSRFVVFCSIMWKRVCRWYRCCRTLYSLIVICFLCLDGKGGISRPPWEVLVSEGGGRVVSRRII